ncbi:GNAT family N-acetyltransferase [Actinoplanes sp. NBRC 101535]|uniref:GNAT family N-acetyltransferase n=1 Tax=Actinoplanes sp. NBRC 101535 TaxID=3032196 RepID=UPI0024A069DE|nr:GNAT family N-acetyltransferase [Actinoplanes sp. NBRC 101535]GLY07680.1 N-acetyltransferase [Actinoplanes sp. NBRC 101535]
MSFHIRSVTWDDPDGMALREAMRAEMRERYFDRPAMVVTSENMLWIGVATTPDGTPVGHAALRRHGPDVEIKRMYVTPAWRGRGVASALLDAIESTAVSLGAPRIILHTGDRQPDAIARYVKHGYTPIPVYEPYTDHVGANCFAKPLD